MSLFNLILKSAWHYRKLNLTIILGIALSTAILVGALIIGDSVKYSLQQITVQRLGKTSQVITAGERLFSTQLADELAPKTGTETAALLRANGFGVIDGGELRINQLAVWGVDSMLGHFANDYESFILNGNEVAINENLASLAKLKVGDEFLLRLNKLNTFPANTPFVSEQEATVSFRVSVARIFKPDELGNFNLQNIQSAPRNVFLNLKWLNEQMGLQQKANVLLVTEGVSDAELVQNLQKCWKLKDVNLEVRENQDLNYTELISDRVFVEPAVEQYCLNEMPGSQAIFSYFINEFSFNGKQSPYSFVSSDAKLTGNQMTVSKWLAEDLRLKLNDTVRLSYFEVGPLRRLVLKDTSFVVGQIYELTGEKADQNRMPVIPGLSDADNCRDWKTGVPVDLKKIRPVDEAYWKEHKGTPKAFVSLETAQKLWGNRFGQSTAIRVDGLQKAEFEKELLAGLLPSQLGFEVRDVKTDGLAAASGGTDFGGLFIGLSFFVLFAAVLLAFLLFKLYLGFRKTEIGTLTALGFSFSAIRKLFVAEASVFVLAGILLGIPFSIFYNHLILQAINTIWVDIVRTSIVNIHIRPVSLIMGSLIIDVMSFTAIWFILNRFLKSEVVVLQKRTENKQSHFLSGRKQLKTIESSRKTTVFNRLQSPSVVSKLNRIMSGRLSLNLGLFLITFSFFLLFSMGFRSGEINPEMFFISGFGLLPGLILIFDFWIQRLAVQEKAMRFSLRTMLLKRIAGERRRNVMIVSFLSVGVFMVVSTGLNRKDLTAHADLPSSGTGGYEWFVETTMPVLFDANSKPGREDLNIPVTAELVQFQSQPGDDASCLNLNKISRPRLIAFNPAAFDTRSAFMFATRTDDLDAKHPWLTLNRTLADDVIPAMADQTVIQWGLMKKVGDTLIYKTEEGKDLKLKLVGGLANSVFQGNVIISEDHFNRAFPSVSGSNVFLIDSPDNSLTADDLHTGMRNYGPEIIRTTDRLLAFYTVENTYLNIFLMLGALGLLIGTLGLGILIFRITFEQIPEYALLLSLGFSQSIIQRMVMREKFFLMIVSVFIGLIPAVLSALPSLMSSLYSNLWVWLPAISVLVILSGAIFSFVAVRVAFRQNLVGALRND
ncbi:MAG: ABC transporter permease [Bacteroidota bacterium]|nr:ABC transporter permease [Bacteroidota bacterium]